MSIQQTDALHLYIDGVFPFFPSHDGISHAHYNQEDAGINTTPPHQSKHEQPEHQLVDHPAEVSYDTARPNLLNAIKNFDKTTLRPPAPLPVPEVSDPLPTGPAPLPADLAPPSALLVALTTRRACTGVAPLTSRRNNGIVAIATRLNWKPPTTCLLGEGGPFLSRLAMAKYDFEPAGANEMGLAVGEHVVWLNNGGLGWSLVRNEQRKQGWVPTAYLEELSLTPQEGRQMMRLRRTTMIGDF
ncbi:hypothetical protein QBC35DRAFT_509232 [Podospora australis]|uniref:SH3 domain-containing protein n=1 Tax=Podospora australis TaxID=1536484 RepID=A0AAN6WKA6_9PEZI|nr:hypothetical protein QBC35DRAFT_509232 [Podospora australis]